MRREARDIGKEYGSVLKVVLDVFTADDAVSNVLGKGRVEDGALAFPLLTFLLDLALLLLHGAVFLGLEEGRDDGALVLARDVLAEAERRHALPQATLQARVARAARRDAALRLDAGGADEDVEARILGHRVAKDGKRSLARKAPAAASVPIRGWEVGWRVGQRMQERVDAENRRAEGTGTPKRPHVPSPS